MGVGDVPRVRGEAVMIRISSGAWVTYPEGVAAVVLDEKRNDACYVLLVDGTKTWVRRTPESVVRRLKKGKDLWPWSWPYFGTEEEG